MISKILILCGITSMFLAASSGADLAGNMIVDKVEVSE